MKTIFDTYIPDGFTNVSPYLFTENPAQLISFLQSAFYAKELNRTTNDTGLIQNCILQIGDSCFMISQSSPQFEDMRTAFYLYVNDVDALHTNALTHGAEEIFEPADMDYGDRQSGVKDPAGNYWWISKRLVEKGYHE